MNSKKLCCICVLFSLLAGCASESSIDEKKKKAQITQSNINKNTPQQLTDKDLFGNETTLPYPKRIFKLRLMEMSSAFPLILL